MGDEDVDKSFGGRQRVRPGDEIGELDGQLRRPAQAPTAPQLVAGPPVTDHGHEAAVVEQGVVAAARGAAEGEVDPAGQLAVEGGGASQDGIGDRSGVGQAVEGLVEADARLLRAHDVAHGVAARGAGGEAQTGQLLQHLGDLAVGHPVELDVLTGGQVQPVAAVRPSEASQAPGLLGGEHAARNPHPDHEHVILFLGAHPVRLEGVPVLGGQPGVPLRGEAVQVDDEAGPLGRGDVGGCHWRQGTEGLFPAVLRGVSVRRTVPDAGLTTLRARAGRPNGEAAWCPDQRISSMTPPAER